MPFLIYKHTCSLNGKSYIGITSGSMSHRWSQHVNAALSKKWRNQAFHCAIHKYGKEAWKHEVLAICQTAEEASKLEVAAISQHGTLAPNGYNVTIGGESSYHLPAATKKLISDKLKAAHARGAMTLSPERKKEANTKISLALKGRIRSPEHCKALSLVQKGRKRSAATIEKMRIAMRGKTHTKETKNAIGKASRERKSYVAACRANMKKYQVCFPDGHPENVDNMKEFCKKYNLEYNSLLRTIPGHSYHRNHYRGFVAKHRDR